MGTWAAGNFCNDGALDYVGELMAQLISTVAQCFDERTGLGGGESVLMPSVAIIKTLVEHCGAAPPKPSVIEEWHRSYLAIYDEEIDDLSPEPDFKVERRKVIDETFTELFKLATKFWNR